MDRLIIQPRRNLRNTGAQNNGPREYIILYDSGVVFCSFYKLLDWFGGGGGTPSYKPYRRVLNGGAQFSVKY